jgi:hypothetical protein
MTRRRVSSPHAQARRRAFRPDRHDRRSLSPSRFGSAIVPEGVAVYATSIYPAIAAREKLRIDWDESRAKTWTVQAPHCAMPQPNFAPVRPSWSGRIQSGIDIDVELPAIGGKTHALARGEDWTGRRSGRREGIARTTCASRNAAAGVKDISRAAL